MTPLAEPTLSPVLVINAGSSSLKYQLVFPETAQVLAHGLVEHIGESGSGVGDHAVALEMMTRELAGAGVDLDLDPPRAVGHRVVHGGADFTHPTLIDDDVLDGIRDLVPLAPLHNPGAVTGIEAARTRFDVPQVAVFDTAFFAGLPLAAATYALPRDLIERHRIRRYGFHGTSHEFVAQAGADLLGRPLAALDQIVLHLGNGASASAVKAGRAIETSMGLTPLEGLVMGSRAGDVDPGLHAFLHREEGMSIEQVDRLLNKESGLLGLSGANDFRTVEARRREGEEHASLAFEVYAHRIRHYVGAYWAQLGHLDLLSFTAGVGEHSASVRAAVVSGLEGMGVVLDPARNQASSSQARIISADASPVTVAVVPTDEELAIARQTAALVELLPTS